jgi:hypothetical protein
MGGSLNPGFLTQELPYRVIDTRGTYSIVDTPTFTIDHHNYPLI